MTEREFSAHIATLASAFGRKLELGTIRVYYDHLGDFDAEAFGAAVRDSIRTMDRFPTVSALRELTKARQGVVPESRWLDEPDMTDDERRANLERIRQLTTRIGRAV